jgi:hypothetical protein
MFEVIEFREPVAEGGRPIGGPPLETSLGVHAVEADAVRVGREAWRAHRGTGSRDVVWWVVRVPGESLARWIADSSSPTERALDLTTNQLVEIR